MVFCQKYKNIPGFPSQPPELLDESLAVQARDGNALAVGQDEVATFALEEFFDMVEVDDVLPMNAQETALFEHFLDFAQRLGDEIMLAVGEVERGVAAVGLAINDVFQLLVVLRRETTNSK